MTCETLKWFVQWTPDYTGWEVMLGGFRDSLYKNIYKAKQRRDYLNEHELSIRKDCRKPREQQNGLKS